ncbi:MAG: hypothetical protein ACTSXY_09015 [Promethearchaeota archaeon]
MNEEIMTSVGFKNEVDLIKKSKCPFCEKEITNLVTEFRDELSLKEFGISGLCQQCQDNFFGPG